MVTVYLNNYKTSWGTINMAATLMDLKPPYPRGDTSYPVSRWPRTFRVILFILLVLLFSSADGAELPVFPGAEGFGSEAIGGRGGKVIKITNLNSNGPGSLQAACEMVGRLTIWRENRTTYPA